MDLGNQLSEPRRPRKQAKSTKFSDVGTEFVTNTRRLKRKASSEARDFDFFQPMVNVIDPKTLTSEPSYTPIERFGTAPLTFWENPSAPQKDLPPGPVPLTPERSLPFFVRNPETGNLRRVAPNDSPSRWHGLPKDDIERLKFFHKCMHRNISIFLKCINQLEATGEIDKKHRYILDRHIVTTRDACE